MANRPPAPLLSLEETWARLLAGLSAITEEERLPLAEGSYRVLAEPLRARINVPGFDNSAMDGYAFSARDLGPGSRELPIGLRVAAGDAPSVLPMGTACRIFTGAPLPVGADTVVIQEDCTTRGDTLIVPPQWTIGDHIRRAGEDIRAGDTILEKGRRLTPQAIGLAASCGFSEVCVYRRARVVLLSTGDELREAGGEPLRDGQIYDSNRPMLKALLRRMGCEVESLGPIGDDLEATRAALRHAAERADLIVTTGGVSVGEEDHVKTALEKEGALDLWRVAIKPGKPLAFGHIGRAHFLGLPGNPVSSFVTFLLFVRPLLTALEGETPRPPMRFPVYAGFTRAKGDKRREFLRARLTIRADGELEASSYAQQSSGVLSSVAWADGLVDLPADTTVALGDRVLFLPFEGLLP